MGCGDKCDSIFIDVKKEYQDLSKWGMVLRLKLLQSKLQGYFKDEVYVYVLSSVSMDESKTIRHAGSGPNLEGGLATLCTCKHLMRQNKKGEWEGTWILGVTSKSKQKGFDGKLYLFYLMKVVQSFNSHQEIFEFLKQHSPNALRAKNAVTNRLGDIYEPNDNCPDPLNPEMYKNPCKNHSHMGNGDWKNDINREGKAVPLLLGEKDNTFVWTQPMIQFNPPNPNWCRGCVKLTLGDILCSRCENP